MPKVSALRCAGGGAMADETPAPAGGTESSGPVAAPLLCSLRGLVPSEASSEHSRVSCNDSSAACTDATPGRTMDARRSPMSALKKSDDGKSSRPDECSTQCGAQCAGAMLCPFGQSSASTDDSAARIDAMPGRTKDAGRSTMSAVKTSEGGRPSRPDECSTEWLSLIHI